MYRVPPARGWWPAVGAPLEQGVCAHDSKTHRCAATVNAALMGKGPQPLRRTDSSRIYLGRSAPRAVRVDDDSPGSDHTGFPISKRCGELPAACDESAAITIDATARSAATSGVTVQKSAAAMVVFRYFTRVADHEGPNMPNVPNRTQQWAARYSTMKPDRASRVWRRLKMPVLCAFCAQPVRVRMTLRMNRPLRTVTVGGVGAGG